MSLFITKTTYSGYRISRPALERHMGLQGFLSLVFYYFFKDTYGFGELKDEWVKMLFTVLVTTLPLGGLEYYDILLDA